MPPRKRSKGRENWPEYLKRKKVKGNHYYFWVNPDTKKEESLECPNDFKKAVKLAKELNAWYAKKQKNDLVQQILSREKKKAKKSITIAEALKLYIDQCIKLKQATNTIKSKKTRANIINKQIGDVDLMDLTVLKANETFQSYVTAQSTSHAISIRSMLIDMYALVKSLGLVPRDFTDPVSVTLKPKGKSSKARLTLDEFKVINDLSKKDVGRPWIYRTQLMAVLSGQRVSDISTIRFRKGRDYNEIWQKWIEDDRKGETPYSYIESDYLHIVQKKTKALIKLHLDLRLDEIGYSIRDVVKMCKDRTVSVYLFHHVKNHSKVNRGDRVLSDSISKCFSIYRDKSGLSWGNKKKPSFHEIRAVSADLHEEQGRVAKDILGHKNQATTDIYLDPKSTKWKEIK